MAGTDPVAVRDLLAAGLTPGAIRAAVASGALERLRDGVVAVAMPSADERLLLRRTILAATLRLRADAVVCLEAAGLWQGLPTRRPGERLGPVTVTAPRGSGRRQGLRVLSGVVPQEDVGVLDGIRCTTVARTALDMAAGRPLSEALVVLDAACARTGPDGLAGAFARWDRERGRSGLITALAATDGRAESPLESASRGAMLTAGLPVPELQQWVPDDTGRAWRVDFLWRDQRVIGEADGWLKYASIEDVRREKRREDALRRAGWTIVRWTSDELWRTPHIVIGRIARALGY